MKIIINARFLTQTITGVQRYAREITSQLAKVNSSYEFILVTHNGSIGDPPKSLELYRDNSRCVGHLWEQVRLPHLYKAIGGQLLWSPCNIGPILVKNHIVTIHDASVFAGPEWFSKKFRILYQFYLPILGRRAKKVITDSNFSKTELVKYGVAEDGKIQVVTGGVGQNFFLETVPTPRKTFEAPYLLVMGAGDPRKNISLIIKAWNSIPKDIKRGIKLVISGKSGKAFSGGLLNSFSHDVEFIGYVKDNKLPGLYAGALAFLYPSLYEGFGLPPLEAMACGTPVLATRIGALMETCGDAALYCDPYSEKDISEKIIRLITDEVIRKSLVDKGRVRVKQFSWERAASELLKIFDEVIQR